MQATVTPVPDAELSPGSEQNTGISGTTHAVAYDPAPGEQPRPRRLRPIRYGHARADPPAPPTVPVETVGAPTRPASAQPDAAPPPVEASTAEADTVETDTILSGTVLSGPLSSGTVLSGTVLPPLAPHDEVPSAFSAGPPPESQELSGYDETAGLTYEAPRPAGPPAGFLPEDSLPDDSMPDDSLSAESLAADDDAAGQPGPGAGRLRNDGLGIFGGVATTEVTDDEPERVLPIGAAWNQPVAAAPAADPVDSGEPRGTLGKVRELLRGGGDGDDDDEAPQVGVRDLPVDVQVHFIRMRFIISIVVGVVAGALTRSWEIGLTLAILAWILDTVRRSRSAAIYQNGASFPGARKKTFKQLSKMRREGYFTLTGRRIPDSEEGPEYIDHLVIGPTGLYAIDSEKWDPRLPIRTWNGKKLYHGPQSQKNRLIHAEWEAQQASEILSAAVGSEIVVQPALAIYGPKIPWDITTIRNVDVFTGTSLVKYLRRRGRMKEGVTRLTREEVRTLHEMADRVLSTDRLPMIEPVVN